MPSGYYQLDALYEECDGSVDAIKYTFWNEKGKTQTMAIVLSIILEFMADGAELKEIRIAFIEVDKSHDDSVEEAQKEVRA